MAEYIVNEVGSSSMTIPSKISKNDTLTFNATNTTTETKYNGTMMTYTFPCDCEVRLEVAGARGGKGNRCTDEQVGKGALLKGDFTFLKDDTLLICVGQAGTDFLSSYSDGTTGGGGGGTFIVKKSTDGTGDTYSGSDVGYGWKVKPLVISAGGNGGKDVGYSGTGTIYHGLATTEAIRTLSSYSGGSYSDYYSSSSTSGKSFLLGAQGSTSCYTRNSMSYAGFGGGGANQDDGYGGGGGGYYGGLLNMSACSYIDSSATNVERISGYNFGEGYFKITFLKVDSINARCKIDNSIKNVSSMKVKVNNSWKDVVRVMTKVNGVWK